jgi:hypothetical protein
LQDIYTGNSEFWREQTSDHNPFAREAIVVWLSGFDKSTKLGVPSIPERNEKQASKIIVSFRGHLIEKIQAYPFLVIVL